MASERVSAFQLYFMDNIDTFSTAEEAYIKSEEEWKNLNKSIIYYYMKKEMKVNNTNLYASDINRMDHISRMRYLTFFNYLQ